MSASLVGPRTKVVRAKEHLDSLRSEIAKSLADETYRIWPEHESDARVLVFKTRFPHDLRMRWSAITGDVANNCRSALNHLTWQLVLLNNKKPGGRNDFPIFTDKSEYRKKIGEYFRGTSPEALAIAERLQPYHAGKDAASHPLAVLNKLSNIDKHQSPALTLLRMASGTLVFGGQPLSIPVVQPRILGELEDEAEWFRATYAGMVPNEQVEVKYDFKMAIAFEPTAPGGGKPINEVLSALVDFTEAVVERDFGPLFS